MKRLNKLLISFAFIALLSPLTTPAPTIYPFTDLGTYVKDAKTVLIGECLPLQDEYTSYQNAFYRRVKVKHVLAGTPTKDEIISITGRDALIPSTLYLIYSRHEVDGGKLYTWSGSPSTVKIMPFSNDVLGKDGKEKLLSKFIKDLEGKSVKESLRYIFERRQRQLKLEEAAIKEEMEIVEKALK